MKKMYDLYAAYMSIRDVNLRLLRIPRDDEVVAFIISIIDGVIRRFEEMALGASEFELKDYYAPDDAIAWIQTIRDEGGACDDLSFIYEMEFSYGATYVYDLLCHVLKHTPLSKAWEESDGPLTINGEDMVYEDDAEQSIDNLSSRLRCSFTKEQENRLREILESDGRNAAEEAIGYAMEVADPKELVNAFIPFSKDFLGEDDGSSEYQKAFKSLAESVEVDIYCEDLGDEILGISNAVLPQYRKWREMNVPLKKSDDKVAVLLLDIALDSFRSRNASAKNVHFCGKKEFWYSIYSPYQYCTNSLGEVPIDVIFSVYVIDLCLIHLDQRYHFVEGGVEQWAA